MRRNRRALEQAIVAAKSDRSMALAHFRLALFHDNNSREAKAIPHYHKALSLGLARNARAQAMAWIASSLFKTGTPGEALRLINASRKIAHDNKLI